MARKPLVGTVAENVLAHGAGALNIDGCRVATDDSLGGGRLTGATKVGDGWDRPWMNDQDRRNADAQTMAEKVAKAEALGRWPANLIHDGSDEVLAAFPQAKGQQGALTGAEPSSKTANAFGEFAGRAPSEPRNDTGSAARFFYCAKASKSDRNAGCEHLEAKQYSNDGRETPIENAYQRNNSVAQNNHPTVKPTDLMAYLCRLVTPPGGVVLDPFMGSGSTGKAAVHEGFRFIGCELSPEYLAIANARIAHALYGDLA